MFRNGKGSYYSSNQWADLVKYMKIVNLTYRTKIHVEEYIVLNS